MKAVYTTSQLDEAKFLELVLRDCGLDPVLENELASYASGFPTPAIPLTISVPDEVADQAIRVLRAARSSRRPRKFG